MKEVRKIAEKYQDTGVVFAGHSLGGTAALCLSEIFNNSRAVSFNPGGAATNPITEGPGPDKATVYHIVGDVISTHIAPSAANVIRIEKRDSVFGSTKPHDSTNILANSGEWKEVSADEEDALYAKWSETGLYNKVVKPAGRFFNFLRWLKYNKSVEESPIPGSARWQELHPADTSPVIVSPEVHEINEQAQKNLAERKQRDKLKAMYLMGGGSSRQFR